MRQSEGTAADEDAEDLRIEAVGIDPALIARGAQPELEGLVPTRIREMPRGMKYGTGVEFFDRQGYDATPMYRVLDAFETVRRPVPPVPQRFRPQHL